MRKLKTTNKFNKELKKAIRRGWDKEKLKSLIHQIERGEPPLPLNADEHPLIGNYKDRIECKLKGDQLLIYYIHDAEGNPVPFADIYQDINKQTVVLERIGTHSDLFR